MIDFAMVGSAMVCRNHPAETKAARHRGIGGYWIDGISAQDRGWRCGGRI